MAELVYLTLDWFVYDLRNGLGETDAEIEQNRAHFQQKLPESVQSQLFQQDIHFEAEYQELLPTRYIDFLTAAEPFPLQGYYYPVRLNDTYGLQLDCSIDNLVTPQPVEGFAQLKTELEQRLQEKVPTIGQTWMLSGWLPEAQTQSVEATAKACYEAFLPGSNWDQDLEGQGSLLGATIFELWRYRSILMEGANVEVADQSLQQNQHIIIIIFANRAAAEKAADLYDDWLRLFCFRNKILWAYGQSRFIKQAIKTDFTVVQANNHQHQTLEHFREVLFQIQNALNHYKVNLIQLDFQGRTIDINLSNYQKRLNRIAKEGGAESDLSFLEEFTDIVKNKYLLQITKDSENMKLGLRLLEDAISATRSRLEVERDNRDRNFQEILKYLGVGWATASVASKYIDVSSLKDDPFKDALVKRNVSEDWAETISPLIYILFIAIIVAVIFGLGMSALRALRQLLSYLSRMKTKE
ncbi:MAG: hypothetical protein F6K19_31705 [Cyanothece sp. SIO1E1]|nr:hypothetical protein [Cyanothece sp. SIO1E1]